MDPPEPLAHTMAALDTLAPGATLLQVNVRVPQFLLPQLEAQGFTYEIQHPEPGLVHVFIRRAATA